MRDAVERRRRHEHVERVTARERREELLRLASVFEESVTAVADAVADAAMTLGETAGTLVTLAHATEQQASDASTAAGRAARSDAGVDGRARAWTERQASTNRLGGPMPRNDDEGDDISPCM